MINRLGLDTFKTNTGLESFVLLNNFGRQVENALSSQEKLRRQYILSSLKYQLDEDGKKCGIRDEIKEIIQKALRGEITAEEAEELINNLKNK